MVREITLKGRVPGGPLLGFVSIVIPVDDRYIPLLLVRYSVNGQTQEYGLRFDLDKQSFADHLPDPDQEKILQAAIPKISEIASTEIRRYRYEALNKEFGK